MLVSLSVKRRLESAMANTWEEIKPYPPLPAEHFTTNPPSMLSRQGLRFLLHIGHSINYWSQLAGKDKSPLNYSFQGSSQAWCQYYLGRIHSGSCLLSTHITSKHQEISQEINGISKYFVFSQRIHCEFS